MPSLHRRSAAGKASAAGAPARPGDPPDGRRGWVLRKPLADLDARANPLPPELRRMLEVLEGHFCRERCYCYASNEAIAAVYGCKRRNAQILLGRLEQLGYIARLPKLTGIPGRVGIVLLRRSDPDLPIVAPDQLDQLEPEIRAEIERRRGEHRDRARGVQTLPFPEPPSPPRAQSIAPSEGAIHCAQNKDEGGNKDAGEQPTFNVGVSRMDAEGAAEDRDAPAASAGKALGSPTGPAAEPAGSSHPSPPGGPPGGDGGPRATAPDGPRPADPRRAAKLAALDNVADRIRRQGWRVLWASELPERLERMPGFGETDPPQADLAALRAGLDQLGPDDRAAAVAALTGAAPVGPAGPIKPGPSPVSPREKAEVRRLIDDLTRAVDDADGNAQLAQDFAAERAGKLADRLVSIFGDRDRAYSRDTYRGIAWDACFGRGGVWPAMIQEAFDEACKPGIRRTRGACFIDAFKRFKAEGRRRADARGDAGRAGPPAG